MSEPEPCSSIVADEFVEVVSPISTLHEGRTATHHDEQNDGTCEQVNLCPIVVLPGKDLRSHVSYCSDIARVETSAATTVEWAAEAEVNEFNVEIGVE